MQKTTGSRRARLLTKAAVLVSTVTAVLVAACAGPTEPTSGGEAVSPASQLEPKQGGYLAHLLPYSASNIDPHATDDPTGYGFISGYWYENLVSLDYQPGKDWRAETNIVPWLAESWKIENPTTYTFVLRKGVKFHKGQDLTAKDVAFSYGRFLDPNEKLAPSVKTHLLNLASVEASDSHTVRFTTKKPDADFLDRLANRNVVVVSRDFVESGGDLATEANGTGPFRLESYAKDSRALAVKNPNYWQPGRPHLDGTKMVLRVDDSTMTAAFVAGQADILMRNDKNQFLPIQAAVPNVKFSKFSQSLVYHLYFNITRPPFDKPEVRKAIHLALDRDELSRAVTFGEGTMTAPLVPAGKTGWAIADEELKRLPGYRQPKDADVAEAKRLLAQAGHPNGFRTTLGFRADDSTAPREAEGAQEQLKRVLNIEATLTPWDSATYQQNRARGQFDVVADAQGGDMRLPSGPAFGLLHSQGGFAKAAGINDPELDKLIDQQATEFDHGKRGQIFQQLQRRILEQAYSVPLIQPTLYAIYQPWIYDWVDNRAGRQTVMNPTGIWMDLDQAPADRRQPN